MAHCADYRDHLLDFVYGLLEEPVQQELHAHLAACPDCHAALAAAQAQQNLLARAARPFSDVPEFLPPPLEAAPAQRRRFLRALPAWTAAAAALVLAVGAWAIHRQNGLALELELAVARQRVDEYAVREAALPAKAAQEQAQITRQAQAEALQVHVLGPDQLHPVAGRVLHVSTRDLEGRPASAQVTARLLSGADHKVLYETIVATEGATRVPLPPVAQAVAASARLVVAAHTATAQAEVEEALHASPPALVAHLATNKSQYQLGDTLYFRALTVERYGQAPATSPVPLRADLVDRAGTVVAQSSGPSDAAGVFAGHLPIADGLVAGNYTLRIQATVPNVHLQAQNQPLEIVRDLVPDLQLDKYQYRPGDQVNVVVNRQGLGNVKPRVTVDNQAVDLNMQQSVNGPVAGMAGGGGLQLRRLNPFGLNEPGLQFQFPLPKKLDNTFANVEVQLDNGKKKETLRQKIAIGLPQMAVDFFPEGGDLVAGVPSRIYYHVHSSAGEADSLEGRLSLLGGQLKVESEFRHGMGSFVFTPDQQETYAVALQSAAGSMTIAHPFRQLGIKPEGVVLHVPDSVGNEGEPIRAQVRSRGAARRVLLLVECRGQLVEEQWALAGAQETPVELRPAAGAHGVLRVTAYEAREGGWHPLAERLVYRAPAARLQLQLAPARVTFRPGETAHLDVSSRDETGKPAAAWILAAVVDERYLPPAGDLRSFANLEDATLALGATPAARRQLDLVLGTHGWRHFVGPDLPALARLERHEDKIASAVAAPVLFSKENASLADLQRQTQKRIDEELERAQRRIAQQRRELTEGLQSALSAVAAARTALEASHEHLRMGLGVLGCALFGISLVLLAVGLARLRRGRLPAFAGAFACLLFCAGLSIVVFTPRLTDAPRPEQASAPRGPSQVIELQRAAGFPLPTKAEALPPAGLFAEASSRAVAGEQVQRRAADVLAAGKTQEQAAAPAGAFRLGTNLARSEREAVARPPGAATPRPAAAPALRGSPAPAAPKADALPSKMGVDRGLLPERAISYRRSAGLPADTLLWLPALYLEQGTAKVSFEVPAGPASYRVLLFGHSAQGRFGFYESRLEVSAQP